MQTNVRDTSLRALKEHRIKLGHDQKEVFRVFMEFGPLDDEGVLEILQAKELGKQQDRRHTWRNSDMPARRGQLMKKEIVLLTGLIIDRGAYFGRVFIRNKWTIRQHHFWSLWNDRREIPEGWFVRFEDVSGHEGHKRAKRQMAETLF